MDFSEFHGKNIIITGGLGPTEDDLTRDVLAAVMDRPLRLDPEVLAHIERRFGQTWSKPNPRMREFVRAVRAIWRAWNQGEKLDFRMLAAFDAERAVVANAGSPGYIFKTADGGKTWQTAYKDERPGFFVDSLVFWDEKRGLAVGDCRSATGRAAAG